MRGLDFAQACGVVGEVGDIPVFGVTPERLQQHPEEVRKYAGRCDTGALLICKIHIRFVFGKLANIPWEPYLLIAFTF